MTAAESPAPGGDEAGTDDCGKTRFEPATILATAYPAVGKEAQWEQALGELVRTSLSFPGHLGTTVLKPTVGGGGQYRIITKFDSIENMEKWRDSDERRRRVAQITRYESKPADIHYVTG
ncbi:MAG: antibiotic biosynthesis monooxygenase, partial [Maioricimonas sp. JB049]